MSDKATPVRVGITLTGRQYRDLCRELEYHEQTLKQQWQGISGGPDKLAAAERLARFRDLRGVVNA